MHRSLSTLVAVLVWVTICQPASAAVLGSANGYTYVTEKRVLPASELIVRDRVVARCPKALDRIGGGTSLSGPPALSFIDGSGGMFGRDWTSLITRQAYNEPTVARSWAICTTKVEVYEKSTRTRLKPDERWQFAGAKCDGGRAASGSVFTYGSISNASIFEMSQLAELDGARPGAGWYGTIDYRGAGDGARLEVTANCVNRSEDPRYPERQRFRPGLTETLIVKCQKGRSVTGGGMFLSGADAAHPSQSRPWDDPDDADMTPSDGWRVTLDNPEGDAGYSLTATAVCL